MATSITRDLALEARKLALRHVAKDADRGISEDSIRRSQFTSGGPEFYGNDPKKPCEYGAYTVRIAGNKVKVELVHSVKVDMTFSLHELYEECWRGQMSLL